MILSRSARIFFFETVCVIMYSRLVWTARCVRTLEDGRCSFGLIRSIGGSARSLVSRVHTHIHANMYIYTHPYRMVRKRRKRQIVEMEEGQAAETVPFVRVTFGQVGSAGREFMGLFHDEGTRRWPVPCGSDLILPIPREDTRGYTCISRLCMELARSLLHSKLEIFFRPAKRNLSSSDLKMKYGSHREKFTLVRLITPIIYIQSKKKGNSNIILFISLFF